MNKKALPINEVIAPGHVSPCFIALLIDCIFNKTKPIVCEGLPENRARKPHFDRRHVRGQTGEEFLALVSLNEEKKITCNVIKSLKWLNES